VLQLAPEEDPWTWGDRSYNQLPAEVLQRLTGLEHLCLGAGCTIRRADAAQLGQLTRLTHLSVLTLRVEGPAQAVLHLPGLQQLGCAYIGPAQPGAAGAALLLPQLTQLRVGRLLAGRDPAEGLQHPFYEAPDTEDEWALEEAVEAAHALFSTAGCLQGLLPLPRLLELELTVDDADWAPLAAGLAEQHTLTSLRRSSSVKMGRAWICTTCWCRCCSS
jgi:hypothetical protein